MWMRIQGQPGLNSEIFNLETSVEAYTYNPSTQEYELGKYCEFSATL